MSEVRTSKYGTNGRNGRQCVDSDIFSFTKSSSDQGNLLVLDAGIVVEPDTERYTDVTLA